MPAVASKPRRGYSFTDHAVANPLAPPPGDRLDGEVDRINRAISQIIDWVSVSLNADGSLKASPRSPPPPRPTLFGRRNLDHGDSHVIAGADPTASAQDWAETSFEWAEHMPDTIPPNILAWMGITGDHWSARWWAHRALEIANAATGGTTVSIGAVPPVNPGIGWLWWCTTDGQLYVFYDDLTSHQWVAATNQQDTLNTVTIGEFAPSHPNNGWLWWCPTDGQLYVFYDDLTSRQWVAATNQQDTVFIDSVGGGSGAPEPAYLVNPASGDTVYLLDFRPVYVNAPGPLAALTIHLPNTASALLGSFVEISFQNPITALTLRTLAGGALSGMPTSAYGPGAAITLRYDNLAPGTPGWIYWK